MMSKLTDKQYIRYSSHVLLPEIGELGQLKLLQSSVLIIGVGGLGHAVAQQLAAAGVKHITLMDDDTVELSNLPRQLLFNEQDIGQLKVNIVRQKLSTAYSDCKITAVCKRFTAEDFYSVDSVNSVDLVFDCTDNFASRLLINQAVVNAKGVLISAAISGANGQLFCIAHSKQSNFHGSGCYQCLYPDDSNVSQSCAQAGVLTSALLSMASMQSLLGLNWLTSDVSQRDRLKGQLHLFNAHNLQWRKVTMSQDPDCCICTPSCI
ncbi:HesA/MoeB/ThiF family protein [Shewanella electrodiphila]|uniref:HesA/MoeB/ThiF family protein n=1 Tax=Shewanella electrodiphila TaxID=934143 RepID=A0ABT0KMR9_9GAMM|nr:HesA/MoeB/ThiF family protein [Shewanella electrodiphila]MCL1045133.1 HesA/MoeB/ThiF family protein [Shewanella electrodiphila]